MYNTKHQFPRGYKTWCILNEMNKVNGMTYGEIIKYAYEMSHGAGTFDKRNNRGYWSGAFVQAGIGSFPWSFKRYSGPIAKYAVKGRDGKYRVNDNGFHYIMQYSTQREGKNVVEGVKVKMEIEKESTKVNEFNERYSKQLDRLKERINEKGLANQTGNKATVCYGNKPTPEEMAVAIRKESQKETNSGVRLRGLQLDDKVAYRNTDTNESGVGIITWMELFSKTIGERDGLEIKGIGEVVYGTYNEKKDKFYMAGGLEIEIIKI
jgi:hypothetical protein